MNIRKFLGLIVKALEKNGNGYHGGRPYSLFYVPAIQCKDGFTVSLQIHNGAYASSENGYRAKGYDWQTVEFGFPNMGEELLMPYAECGAETPDDVMGQVGSVPMDVVEKMLEKHGGVDWFKTTGVKNIPKFLKKVDLMSPEKRLDIFGLKAKK